MDAAVTKDKSCVVEGRNEVTEHSQHSSLGKPPAPFWLVAWGAATAEAPASTRFFRSSLDAVSS